MNNKIKEKMEKKKEKKRERKVIYFTIHMNGEGDVMHPMFFSTGNMVLTTHHPF